VKASTRHTILGLAWAVLIIPTLLWWRQSLLWVAFMSLYANIASHWGAREAARAKETAEEAAQ
jgi:hypothetical protein